MDLIISQDSLGENSIKHVLDEQVSECRITVEKSKKAVVTLEIDSSVQSVNITCTVEDHADLLLLCVQSPLATSQSIAQKNSVGEAAVLRCQNITLGSQVEHNIESHLHGVHAQSSVDWIAYAKSTEKQKISAANIFHAKDGAGEIHMKGVAEDSAHLVCNGMINIEEGGGGTDTYLTEEVLMLDPTCTVDAIPGLEIKTNDVKASHSATVSRVTEEDLFYIAARGISQPVARRMFVLGFLGELLEKIQEDVVRQDMLDRIGQKYS